MPELPEIVAHTERLARDYTGAELTAFVPLHLSALKTYAPSPREVYGASLTATGSRGKYLFLHFAFDGSTGEFMDESTGDFTFVLHLMQGVASGPIRNRRGSRVRGWPVGCSQTVRRCC